MPKLARQYERDYYGYRNTSEYWSNRTYNYSSSITSTYRPANPQTRPQPFGTVVRPKRKKAKKKSLLGSLIWFALIGALIFPAMNYSYDKVSKAIFTPTPYKNIQTDLYELAFPLNKYLSNSWVMGDRIISYSADEKHAQMVPLVENVNMPALKQSLMNLMEQYQTVKPAIYVWDYDTQNYIDINASKIYATASIIKIPVLIEVFKSIEAGHFSLDDTMPLTEYYRTEGSGSLQFKAHNSQYTIDKLAEIMITESDNSATNMLMAKVGSMEDINRAMRDWGLKNTKVNTWLPDLSGTNYTTARDMAQMIYNIDENEKFLSEESRAKMLNYMGHVHNNRLIGAGLGAGSVFLHKTGDIGTMLGDAGIVIAPNGKKYIAVILANRPYNSFAGKEFIVEASKIIYNHLVR
ncbi:MAG: serine hydrolase [Cyanobacteria bacterium SIG26]|nr:serine hydrolase [Cyanobacteria bacterium SIG26]